MSLQNVSVTRNDASVTFSPTEVKKGAQKGKVFLGPADIKDEDLPNVIKWLGNGILKQIVSAVLRQRAKGWSDEAEDESATQKEGDKVISFDSDKYTSIFSQMASDFNLRGESIPELRAQMDELTDKFSELDFTNPAQMVVAAEMAEQIKALKIAINSKKRTKEEATA